jgi:acyl-coenzyme A synthetase/AMP-(fatty) acid ligase
MSGYWNEPELTAEVLKSGRVVSADLGYRGEDGMIYICGRKTDIIVSGANKISPFEVEDAVLQIDGIKECAVIGKADEVMGQLPVLFAVCSKHLDKAAIILGLESKIERFKVPKPENIIFFDALPKTEGTGKVVKKKLEGML